MAGGPLVARLGDRAMEGLRSLACAGSDPKGIRGMRRLLLVLVGLLIVAALYVAPGDAADCRTEDFARAVNDAGAALRKLSAENTPRLQAKMSQLKTKMKWPDAGYEERAYQALQDERIAALDTDANALLAKIDALGTVELGASPDCGKLQELQAVSLELQATVKTKTAYLLSKLDPMLGSAPAAASPKAKPAEPKAAAAPEPAAPKPARPPAASDWSTKTTGTPPPPSELALAPAPLPPAPAPAPVPAEAEGYTIEEIRAA